MLLVLWFCFGNLCQERPGLKYGFSFFFFFCYHEGHILFEELPLQKRKQKRLCIDSEALVCFMNDDIECDTPGKTTQTFRQKSQT